MTPYSYSVFGARRLSTKKVQVCGLPQLKRFHANDLHIFDFHDHVSEFPSKNVRFFILEKYTQKYYFRPFR